MSEVMSAWNSKRNFRWQLLTTVSAMALFAAAYGSEECKAADQDADHPTVWIELGGQIEHINGQGDAFAPGFLAANPGSPVLQPTSPLQAQRPGLFSFAEEGKISIQPENSNWIFSFGVNYGRSSNFKHVDHQTNKTSYRVYKYGVPVGSQNPNTVADFADTHVRHRESHAILDFSVGKDVGLGMFGRDGSSALSLGMRFAQFASQATFDVRARPDLRIEILPLPTFHATLHLPYFHTYHATGQASRSFHGIGPSLSWNGSTPFVGDPQRGEVTFDWGANAALLFGRQKARVGHQETAHYESPLAAFRNTNLYPLVYQHSGGHNVDRFVIVPNAGGFAGASYRVENFKVSLGYRADFFFGAVDGGVDARKSSTLGFYGPFASVSVGIGG
jgi:iron complex outermembrane receptor protein